ncbi:hypothetical protein VNO77_39541 [Canavalia gladiata]|uniref:Chaperone protein dnaJ 15-like n=1 Tax=Canavalia gladiata TaxID=3824 RepID=A0AAN9JZ02_CANGL
MSHQFITLLLHLNTLKFHHQIYLKFCLLVLLVHFHWHGAMIQLMTPLFPRIHTATFYLVSSRHSDMASFPFKCDTDPRLLIIKVYVKIGKRFSLLSTNFANKIGDKRSQKSGELQLDFSEDSEKTGKVTSAGMYFLHFQVYRMDSTVNALAMAKDPEAAFFKRLEGLQPCEVLELKSGTHIFAVYGDNFFKTASYTIEAVCAKSYEETSQKLQDIEGQILRKRNELRQFETEYRKALARYQEVTDRCTNEKQSVDELLKQRDTIHSSFTIFRPTNISGSGSNLSNGSTCKIAGEDSKVESSGEDVGSDGKDKSGKKKWFNLNRKGSDKRLG